jgi:tetratricopeptide (TPR) repeat protein
MSENPSPAPAARRAPRLAAALLLVLLVNSAYLVALPSPTLFYMANAALHLAAGCLLVLAAALAWRRLAGERRPAACAGLLALAAAAGLALAVAGNTTPHRWLLWTHAGAAALAVVALLPWLVRRAAEHGGGWRSFLRAYAAAAALLLLLPAGAALGRRLHPDPSLRVANPRMAALRMEEEGGGPASPFFPSSARTNVGGIIPADFFTQSDTCGECHRDIYRQWRSSVHHFASFNNQFYRKSIEYMQDVVGTRPSKWCAGCHDHAVFFNGRFDRPIREQIDTREARAGLACTSCHAMVHVASTLGNGDFTIGYPPLHELAASRRPLLRAANHFMTYLEPRPHRATFMKPFVRLDTSELCSTCHKVHLDVPVNHYRWFRGFNEYDAWQASGISGQGARSFYYPKEPKGCADCHMPLVPSQDPGNVGGKVHSHRFPGANTAVPFVNRDREQLAATVEFLQSGFVTADIFAAAPERARPAEPPMLRRAEQQPEAMSTFAVGEEAERAGAAALRDEREVAAVEAPLDAGGSALAAGSTVRLDVVVRTRAVGHFFPGGTVDAFDVWLELEGQDAAGRVIFWSGRVEDGGRGPVEPGAHFYRSYQLDGASNRIDKRNAWATRSVLYVHLIPPGAADVAHFRVRIPPDAAGPLTFTARVRYRKFSHDYTRFAYAGRPRPGQDAARLAADHDSREFTFERADIPANVSGEIRGEIPELPIVTVASATVRVPVARAGAGASPVFVPRLRPADRERWNDWGIGLLLQGDLKGAEFAFRQVTRLDPGYADGWLNVARTLIREGELAAARPFLARARRLGPGLGRVRFFQAMVEKGEGRYDAALAELRATAALFPRDRVVLNQIARVLFLERRYAEALPVLDRVCDVDPEDVQMHYTAMLCARALGDRTREAREAALFRRFKADEAAQAITAARRRLSPEDNNERQAIHEHESVPLGAAGSEEPGGAARTALPAAMKKPTLPLSAKKPVLAEPAKKLALPVAVAAASGGRP